MPEPQLYPDNICPNWCENYHQFGADGKHTEESKKACMACANLDIVKFGQDGFKNG